MKKIFSTIANSEPHPFLNILSRLEGSGYYFSLKKLNDPRLYKLPYCIRVLLENLIRNCDNYLIKKVDIENILDWRNTSKKGNVDISYFPSRVLLQDFTGVPAIVDLAAMRDAILSKYGLSPEIINPKVPVDLVIDHSVQVDFYGRSDAVKKNLEMEFYRNKERFEFLKWGSKSFDNLRIVPPGFGIIHQVNLEYLARTVFKIPLEKEEIDKITLDGVNISESDSNILYPDSLVGTDSHTTMICGLGILGWGVGGLEAEAVMLGQPITMNIPEVIGAKLIGNLQPAVTSTDIVLTITSILRQSNVVGKFVEFFGDGIKQLSVEDRATISNMSPEYGATIGYFYPDEYSLHYLSSTGRSSETVHFVQKYLEEQCLGKFTSSSISEYSQVEYSEVIVIDLSMIEPCAAGPKRPQDKVALKDLKQSFQTALYAPLSKCGFAVKKTDEGCKVVSNYNSNLDLAHGSIVLASITSCTNTSNPLVMIGAGLLAKKAVKKNLKVPEYIKTSFSPGSHIVEKYLQISGLLPYMEKLGFYTVGYGCMTCIGNSGNLSEEISNVIKNKNLVAVSVLSGNRNFEGRVHPLTKANYLVSPPLVIAFALAGRINIDMTSEPLGINHISGEEVYLKDIWPTREEILELESKIITPKLFNDVYSTIPKGTEQWNSLEVKRTPVFRWNPDSTYIHKPPFFDDKLLKVPTNTKLEDIYCLLNLGDSITTDHISPASDISQISPAAKYLLGRNVKAIDFNTYGARRGNDEVMVRGTFGNVRIINKILYKENCSDNTELHQNIEGPYTLYIPNNEILPIYDAAQKYRENNQLPLLVIAGKEYGSGSSRDWAAKGPRLLGVQVIIAASFERIHRSNLIGMGIIPLQFLEGENADTLGLDGTELFSIDLSEEFKPRDKIEIKVRKRETDKEIVFNTILRLDTNIEIEYYKHGGILPFVLDKIAKEYLSEK
ncbi:aconitate hydratase, putative [Cryptosporidium muris RN66]|uniref:Aconitate hydratase n=1 Tax=Cryptosporidium muris (strain RN66) TaxID=441375 RepID=B6ADB7_CRYMR|nr:aconitate hydratase, putative [Cryptosporidium muris RN66]EEA06121.1 aconitate hydratase, putative [Cryptosporidium muris RN66]|eukprot:XP_002140470.1 aconitate hydratase [Cryptosporidium muris RN66]